jgi:hypothetical protein
MNKSLLKGFDSTSMECTVYYNKNFMDYDVVKLVDVKKKVRHMNSVNSYIQNFIDKLKNNVIKKLPCLNLVTIQLSVLDNNNIIHRFVIKISNILQDLLKCKEKINFNKTIIVCILYDNKIVFVGGINFTGLD